MKLRTIAGRPVIDHWPSWEQRRMMKAADLIAVMGDKWIGHPAFKQKPRSLVQPENLAGKQPVIQHWDTGLLGQFRALIYWVMQ